MSFAFFFFAAALLAACGGGDHSSSPPAPVVIAPTITVQPVSTSVAAGQTATFRVTAAGTAPLQYQWYKNAVLIDGATAAIYTTPATTTADSGSPFEVIVRNTAGALTSDVAMLTVTATAA